MAKNNFINSIGRFLGFPSDLLSSLQNHFQSWLNSQTGAALTGAEEQANQFTAAEAAKERQWQESMRATNYQTQVQDMQSAGLNPALMYASGGSSSTPSGASASSVAPNSPASLSDMIQLMMLKKQMNKIDAETHQIETQAELNQSTVAKTEKETSLLSLQNEWYPKLSEAQVNEIDASVKKLEAEVPYLNAMKNKASAEVGFINAQKILTQKNTGWIDKINTSLVALQEAQRQHASSAAVREAAEAAWLQFQQAYAALYKTTVPSGGVAAILSYFQATFNPDNEAFQMFIDAIRESGAKVDVNNSTTNEYVLPHSDVKPGTLSNPYASPRN